MMRALEEGLPRWDGRSPALIARLEQTKAEASAFSAVEKAKAEAEEAEARAKQKAQAYETALSRLTLLQGRPRVQEIIESCAERYGMRAADITGPRIGAAYVQARHEAIALAYVARPDMSLPQIGRLFGNRNHTTILHAVKKMGVHRSVA